MPSGREGEGCLGVLGREGGRGALWREDNLFLCATQLTMDDEELQKAKQSLEEQTAQEEVDPEKLAAGKSRLAQAERDHRNARRLAKVNST